MASPTLPALSPRASKTRKALIAAGFDLLVERPIDAIPIDDLVAKAGVAKGSFFNHFKDKREFGIAIGTEVRLELEALVAQANLGISDPVERMVGGMCVSAKFALTQPKRSTVLLRSQATSTALGHPLNKGLRKDIEAACDLGLLRPESKSSGVLYWLGLCQILMVNLVENIDKCEIHSNRLNEMLVLGLTGLGVSEKHAREVASIGIETCFGKNEAILNI